MGLRVLLFFCFVQFWSLTAYSQTDKKDEKSSPVTTKWYISGYDFTFSAFGTYDKVGENNPMVKYFDGISQHRNARDQFDFDVATTRGYSRHQFYIETNKIIDGSLELIVKRKVANPNSFINFVEFRPGIAVAQHTCYLNFYGDSASGDTTYYEFKNDYFMEATVLKATFSVQVKTPQIFGFLSAYGGVGGFFGDVYDMPSSAGLSTLETTETRPPYKSGLKYYNSGHASFTKPNLAAGVSFPVGLKIAFSPRTAFKIGYTRAINTYYMKSKKSISVYNGFNFTINTTINDNGTRIRRKHKSLLRKLREKI